MFHLKHLNKGMLNLKATIKGELKMPSVNIRENISYKVYLQKEKNLVVGEFYPVIITQETLPGDSKASDIARIKLASDDRKIVGFYCYGSSKNGETSTIVTRGHVMVKALEPITAGTCVTWFNDAAKEEYGIKAEQSTSKAHDLIGVCMESCQANEYTSIIIQL